MRLATATRHAVWMFVLLAGGGPFGWGADAVAQGRPVDRLGGDKWSPNSEWLALNWPDREQLFIISLKTGVSYLLRPVGNVPLAGGESFSGRGRPEQVDLRRTSRIVPSPGQGTLAPVEWSPDSAEIAYRADAKTRAIFSLSEESVTRRLAASEVLPWHESSELRVTFELIPAAQGRPESYWMRIAKADGTIVKEIAFRDPREVRCVAALRSHDTNFLDANHQFLYYPRVTSNGWQILREPLATNAAPPQAVTKPNLHEPYQWQFSGDGRLLALVHGSALAVGALDDWEHARTIPLPHEFVTIDWSPDSRYLALLDGSALSVLPRDGNQPTLVTRNCSPRFWGWRGSRLYFGDARTDLTNLSYIDADHSDKPAEVVTKARLWDTATRDVSLSPDGARLTCLEVEIDYMGRVVWQLWQCPVQTNTEWKLMYELKRE